MELSPSRVTEFGEILEEILGLPNVYFQPPPSKDMQYPCLVYELDDVLTLKADNGPYSMFDRYQVTFIRNEPDSPVIRKLLSLKYAEFSRHFATSGLNHDVITIYY